MSFCLVADIGGTNGRFAIFDGHSLTQFRSYRCADFQSLQLMLNDYLSTLDGSTPKEAVLAVATHVSNDRVAFTNLPWAFSVEKLAKAYGFSYLKVMNDFTAVSIAVPHLGGEQLIQVGGDSSSNGEYAKAIIGAGTGLGASGLFCRDNTWVPIQGQGGHVNWGPCNAFEHEIFISLLQKQTHVSAESVLSGRGIQRLYRSVCEVMDIRSLNYNTPAIVAAGTTGSEPASEKTVQLFCEILGRIAGDLALTLGARSGVYIAGGIVTHMLNFFVESSYFRKQFQQKGCMTSYMEGIPAYVISEGKVGLIGAVEARKTGYDSIGITYSIK